MPPLAEDRGLVVARGLWEDEGPDGIAPRIKYYVEIIIPAGNKGNQQVLKMHFHKIEVVGSPRSLIEYSAIFRIDVLEIDHCRILPANNSWHSDFCVADGQHVPARDDIGPLDTRRRQEFGDGRAVPDGAFAIVRRQDCPGAAQVYQPDRARLAV